MDEKALIQLAQDGNSEAFRALFEENKRRVYLLAYRYLKSKEDAEDVLQETFIKAFHSLRTYRLEKGISFSTWLYRITINASIDMLRRNNRREKSSLEAEEMNKIPASSHFSNPEHAYQSKEASEKIHLALSKLSPKQRMIFTLRHYQEFNTREIAECMNSSEGSIKRHLFRAMENLKKNLKKFILENDYEMQKS